MIIVDMNLSPDWVALLFSHGFENIQWRDLGDPSAGDRIIFDHAQKIRAAVLTQDLDFGTILGTTNAIGPSVVLLRMSDVDPSRIGSYVVRALQTCAAELEAGAILTIDENRPRVRLLPLRPNSPL